MRIRALGLLPTVTDTCRKQIEAFAVLPAGIALPVGQDGVLERAAQAQLRSGGMAATAAFTTFAGVVGILVQHRDDLVDGDIVVPFVPAVVVGDHRQGGVADLGLAGELGLLQVGHADHVGAPASVEVRLGAGRELRAFHADVGAAAACRRPRPPRRPSRKPVRHGAQTGSPKATWATMPSPKKVPTRAKVRSMNWSGITKSVGLCSSFSEPTAETERMRSTPSIFMRVDVCAKVELGGQDAVAASMPRQKGHAAAFKIAENERVGWIAERGGQPLLAHVGESGHGIQTTAPDDADLCLLQLALLLLE